MKTNVQATSLDAYDAIKSSPKLQAQQIKILAQMQHNRIYTRRELAALARMETSTASARINSLLDDYIEVDGVKKDPLTGKNVQALRLKLAQVDMFKRASA